MERNPHPRAVIEHKPFTQAENDTIIAALRLWWNVRDYIMRRSLDDPKFIWSGALLDQEDFMRLCEDAGETAGQNGPPLDVDEIDALIERLRT